MVRPLGTNRKNYSAEMLLVTMNARIHRHQRNRGRGLDVLLLKHEHAIDCTYEE